jgi:AraC family transcriptional regulator
MPKQVHDSVQQLPVVFKKTAAWRGLRLAHYRLGQGLIPEHRHNEHLIIISLGNCQGELRTANGLHMRKSAVPYSVCVIPSGHAFQGRVDRESEFISLLLDPALVSSAAAAENLTRRAEIVERWTPSDLLLSNVGLALLTELRSEGLSGRLYTESLANILAIHLLRHYSEPHPDSRFINGGLTGYKLRKVTDFIEENYERDLALAEMAGAAGISPFHFAREFKKATGLAPHQYLIKVRIERAKASLTKSELPIVEVGLRAGFNNQSHFTRLFHKRTGVTPKAYRNAFRY